MLLDEVSDDAERRAVVVGAHENPSDGGVELCALRNLLGQEGNRLVITVMVRVSSGPRETPLSIPLRT